MKLKQIRLTKEEEIEHYEKYKNGDVESGKLIIESVLPWAFQLAQRKNIQEFEFDDLLQEVFVAVVECFQRFDPYKSRFTTFVALAIHWRILKLVRKYKNERSINLPDPEIKRHFNHEEFEFEDALEHLPERDRKIITMRYYGYTLGEIGEQLNITRERVRQLEKRAIEKIKEVTGCVT